VAAWPAEEIEERAGDIAAAAYVLLRRQAAWRHRRVETLTVLSHEQVRRHVSVDFTVPEEHRELLRLSPADEYAVPLAFLAKWPLVHFDLRNEEGHSVPLLTAEQNRMIGRELLYQVLDADLADQDADEPARATVVTLAAGPLIEAVLADDARRLGPRIETLESDHALASLIDFRAMADLLSRRFILWAVVRGVERRRVLKFASDEPFSYRPGFRYFYAAPGCTEASSYHVEVAVPPDLRARTTRLSDDATGAVLATGDRNSDRPALYFTADPVQQLVRPGLAVAYGAERWRFLGPAAIVATVIALLVAPPLLFADLQALSGSAGPAIGLVLSTSAVFSALVLRTDEHPLLRLMLLRYRLCLVACTLAALFAAAALGFQARPWIIQATWALAALVSVFAAGILIVGTVRSPSVRSGPAPEQP
jgi:hypothetical protein